MAAGDSTIFDQFWENIAEKVHNLGSDTLKLGLTNGTTVPIKTIADPRWGAGGTTNFAAEEVAAGGSYTAGGEALVSVTSALSTSVYVLNANDILVWVLQAGSPTNARYAILYNNTDAGKHAILAIDLGVVKDLTLVDIPITWNSQGILRIGAAADIVG